VLCLRFLDSQTVIPNAVENPGCENLIGRTECNWKRRRRLLGITVGEISTLPSFLPSPLNPGRGLGERCIPSASELSLAVKRILVHFDAEAVHFFSLA